MEKTCKDNVKAGGVMDLNKLILFCCRDIGFHCTYVLSYASSDSIGHCIYQMKEASFTHGYNGRTRFPSEAGVTVRDMVEVRRCQNRKVLD